MSCFPRKKIISQEIENKSKISVIINELQQEQLSEFCVILKQPKEFNNSHKELEQILHCSPEDAKKFVETLAQNDNVKVFVSSKASCTTLSLNLQGNNIPSGIMSLTAFNDRKNCYGFIESYIQELTESIDECDNLSTDLSHNNNLSQLVYFCANDCSRLGSLIGNMLLLCNQSEIFEIICSEFKIIAKSTALMESINQMLKKSPQINACVGEKLLLDIFTVFCEFKDPLFLNSAAYVMAATQSLSIQVLKRYITLFQKFDQKNLCFDYTKCNLQLSKHFKQVKDAHAIIKSESKKDYRLFFDYMSQLNFLVRQSYHIDKVWMRIQYSDNETKNPYYSSRTNNYSLEACDLNCLQIFANQEPKLFLEKLMSDDSLWTDVRVLEKWLMLLIQFALNQHEIMKSHESLLINELAKCEKNRKNIERIKQDHLCDFEESLFKVAEEYQDGSKFYFRVKKQVYDLVTPFHASNKTTQDRDSVFDFINNHDLNCFPLETPNLLKFDILENFLEKVLQKTNLQESVFAILCAMDLEKTKKFIKYVGTGRFSKFFLNKISKEQEQTHDDNEEVCAICFGKLVPQNNQNEPVYLCSIENSQIFKNEKSGWFLHTCGHRIHKFCYIPDLPNAMCMICSNYFSHVVSPQSIGYFLRKD